jgi:hypothetical protein
MVALVAWADFIHVFATTPNTDGLAQEQVEAPVAVSALVFESDATEFHGYRAVEQSINFRPSRVKTLQSFAQDVLNNTIAYVVGADPRVRFYAA